MSDYINTRKTRKKRKTARKQSIGKKVIDVEDTFANEKDGRESFRVSETQKEHSEGMSDCTDTDKIEKKKNTARKQSERKKVIDLEEVSPPNEKDVRESCRASETQKEHSEGITDYTNTGKARKKMNTAKKQSKGIAVLSVVESSTIKVKDKESSREDNSEGKSECIEINKNR